MTLHVDKYGQLHQGADRGQLPKSFATTKGTASGRKRPSGLVHNGAVAIKKHKPNENVSSNHMARKGGSKTVTEKKQKGSKKDASNDQTFYTSSDGKRVKKSLANVYKILSANTVKNTYEFNAANLMYSPFGKQMINYYQGAAGQAIDCPIHFVDLTACPNMAANGTPAVPALYWGRLIRTNETDNATVTFSQNGTDLPLQLVGAPDAVSDMNSYPGGKDTLMWSEIKMNLYGATQSPLQYKVMFVQFKKGWLCPNQANVGTVAEVAERVAFWDSFLGTLSYNPILVQNSKHLKDLKILKQDTFRLAPKLSTDLDTAPNIKTVSYFERWNRDVDYSWQDMDSVQLVQTVNNATTTQIDLGEITATADPLKRIYMLITCESYNTARAQPATGASFAKNGTYDIMVKHRHMKVI